MPNLFKGPNILQWGAHCFAKFPGDGTEVPWHQDAQYWPLQPSRTVSVWLAIFDTDEQNAAMRIVKGSHRHVFEHQLIEKEHFVLDQEVDQVAIKTEDIVSIDLKAGEWISTGAATGPIPIGAGSKVEANFGDLGRCTCTMPTQ